MAKKTKKEEPLLDIDYSEIEKRIVAHALWKKAKTPEEKEKLRLNAMIATLQMEQRTTHKLLHEAIKTIENYGDRIEALESKGRVKGGGGDLHDLGKVLSSEMKQLTKDSPTGRRKSTMMYVDPSARDFLDQLRGKAKDPAPKKRDAKYMKIAGAERTCPTCKTAENLVDESDDKAIVVRCVTCGWRFGEMR